MKHYLGIDLGGTFIKGAVISEEGKIVTKSKTPTEHEKGADKVVENIAALCHELLAASGMKKEDITAIGMGVPGMIDSDAGVVVTSNNLGWKNFPIADKLTALTGLPVKTANDANVAALGEVKFGGGKDLENAIMVTLGTGVGSGLVLDGRLYEGNQGAGAELGHSIIIKDGELCTCGRRGCLEAYASATALIRDTKRAMEKHPDSLMWKTAKTLDEVDGATAFKNKENDPAAREVVDNYIGYLAAGLTNFANIFRPEAILLGGGVSAEGDGLIIPLAEAVSREIFAGDRGPQVAIKIAELGNKAGLLGAAALFM